MASRYTLTINGRPVSARIGETLVDAGLGGRVLVPHDCCSGQCQTCRVRVLSGAVDDWGTGEGDTVLACQATLDGDAAIAYDEVPPVIRRTGTVTRLAPLSRDVVEVVVTLRAPLEMLPGQYVGVAFAGFPSRDFSPAPHGDGRHSDDELVFHVKRYPGGIVSNAFGAAIGVGHRVQVRGPFGHAFLRPGSGPLVLVSGGTGWAPIWSLARAAVESAPAREIVVVAGARDMDGLYMRRSLDWLADRGVRQIVATVETGAGPPARPGRPTLYLPSLGPDDTVHVAGVPGLVEAVNRKALAAGARVYADPFTPGRTTDSVMNRVLRAMRRTPPADVSAPRHEPQVANGRPVRRGAIVPGLTGRMRRRNSA